MRQLLYGGMILVVLAVSLMIGGAIVALTENVTTTLAPGSTLPGDIATDVGTTLTTFTSLLVLPVLALIGGLAIGYLMSFLGQRAMQ